MPILAGQTITETTLNRLRPKTYFAVGSGQVVGALTNADVTDATITLTTETAGAEYEAECVWDFDATATGTGNSSARMALDGLPQTPLATFGGNDTAERASVAQNYHGTLPTAGSHTFKLLASPVAGHQVQGVNSSIKVTIKEVV